MYKDHFLADLSFPAKIFSFFMKSGLPAAMSASISSWVKGVIDVKYLVIPNRC
jgi:hypothetical protein